MRVGGERFSMCGKYDGKEVYDLWRIKDSLFLFCSLLSLSTRLWLSLHSIICIQLFVICTFSFPMFRLFFAVMSVHSYQDLLLSGHWVSEPLFMNLVAEIIAWCPFEDCPLRSGLVFIWWFRCNMVLSSLFELIWIFAQCPYVLIHVHFVKYGNLRIHINFKHFIWRMWNITYALALDPFACSLTSQTNHPYKQVHA